MIATDCVCGHSRFRHSRGGICNDDACDCATFVTSREQVSGQERKAPSSNPFSSMSDEEFQIAARQLIDRVDRELEESRRLIAILDEGAAR